MKNQKKLVLLGLIAVLGSLLAMVLTVPPTLVSTITNEVEEHVVLVTNGDTLSGLLAPYLTREDIAEIARIKRREAGVRHLRAGRDIIRTIRQSEGEPVDQVIVQFGPWQRIEFSRTEEDGWDFAHVEIERDVRVVRRGGVIERGESFYLAGLRLGVPEGILIEAFDLLAFEMDFQRDIHAGQDFVILYEENWTPDGEFINTGNIIAVTFNAGGRRGSVRMYRFNRAYYDENGGGAIRALKRTPISGARISSSFNPNRRHPISGFTRAHRGVDFAAPTGTPIPAAGAGRVVERRYQSGGYGNFVRIRHNATYETLYAHMSRFHPNVRVGTQVRQGQIIGFVGSTGASTGPHLHYEIIRNGVHVNPMTVRLPASAPLSAKYKDEFLEFRKRLDAAKKFMSEHPGMVL